ncbi:RNA-helicase [Sheeppox virus]|uniref:RNA helicase NPH-II n=1 Tax=Sheeppox virus TaxID=10266 RepID=A0A5C0PUL9_SHEV|nr:RNA-helicase [Sheeppox virus]
MDKLPNIYYFPNCVNLFPYQYSQNEFENMSNEEKKNFSFAIFPLIKHRWNKSYVVKDNKTYKLSNEVNKTLKKVTNVNIPSIYPTKIDSASKEYTINNIKISFECYSYLNYSKFDNIHSFDDYILRGLLEGGNKLKIFSNNIGSTNSTIGIFNNTEPFFKIKLASLQPKSQQEIFKSWISHKPIILTGGTGVGKTSQVPKLILWFNYLFGGFKNLFNDYTYIEKPIVLSLPRITLVKLHSKNLLNSLGFKSLNESPISLKFGSITKDLINLNQRNYGIVFSTHRITLSKLFDYGTIILDEVHEHDQIGDIIISVTRKYINKIESLFLMTATLEDDIDRIKVFFESPIFVHIPGSTLFNISEVYIKNSVNIKNKFKYIEEEKKNILNAIKKYTPPKNSSGIVFVSSITQCENYKKFLSKHIPYDIHIIHGKVKNIENILSDIYSTNNTSIIISTPYLESSVTINNVTHIYDSGRVYIPEPYGGKEIFISKSMREQRKGRVGRVKPGIYIYFYDISYLKPIKRIDSEFLHNYILYGKIFNLSLPNDLFVQPSNLDFFNKVSSYIDSFCISDEKWTFIMSSYYVNILEYAKIYSKGGKDASALDIFERENVLNDDAFNAIKLLNMRAKIIKHRRYNKLYVLTCKLMFGVYFGKTFNIIHNRPLFGYITMITDSTFVTDD